MPMHVCVIHTNRCLPLRISLVWYVCDHLAMHDIFVVLNQLHRHQLLLDNCPSACVSLAFKQSRLLSQLVFVYINGHDHKSNMVEKLVE